MFRLRHPDRNWNRLITRSEARVRTIPMRPKVHRIGEEFAWPALHHGDLCGKQAGRYNKGMRLGDFGAWCVVFCGVGLCAHAQSTARPRQTVRPPTIASKPSAGTRTLSPDEGLAILSSALESRAPAMRAEAHSDCSHLVHTIYERAGFPYPYVSSSDLYMGTDDFQRVARPQAGDLIVWRGHAGIVVNPRQRTFFSALRSGFGVENYDSAYWMGRGRPHFLRYAKRSPASVVAASSRDASLQPAEVRSTPPIERLPAETASATPEEPLDESSGSQPVPRPLVSPPGVVVIRSVAPRPEQVHDALLVSFRDSAEALEAADLFQLTSPMISFENFQVTRVQRIGSHGWVELRMTSTEMVVGRVAHPRKSGKPERWDLRRLNADTWEVVLPKDAVYLPHDLAVQVLAHQLAVLSVNGSAGADHHEKQAELARWLDVLLAGRRSR